MNMALDLQSYIIGRQNGGEDIVLENLSVTKNDVYIPPEGKAFKRVDVRVIGTTIVDWEDDE